MRSSGFPGSPDTAKLSCASPARFSTARHWHEQRPDALTLPSSSSRRCRCGRESSGTRLRQHYPVRLPSMPLRVHTRYTSRKYWRRTQFPPTQWGKQLAGYSGQQSDSFYPAPIAPESRAAKSTASACPVGSVSLSLALRTRLLPRRPPWQTQARLRPRLPDSREPASTPLPLTFGRPRHGRRRPPPEQQSPDKSLHFPCCPLVRRSPQPVWSAPLPWQDDRDTPRYRMRAPVLRSLRACLYTSVAVPPSRRNPPRERRERREHCAV